MSRVAAEHEIVNALQEWTSEANAPLPLPLSDVVWIERCGSVCDLRSGERFYPTDDWGDFAERWVWEMLWRGEKPEAVRLAVAMQRANDHGWDGQIALAAAHVMLDRAMRKICTAQTA